MLYQLFKLGPSNKDPQVYELRMVLRMPSIATGNFVHYTALAPSIELTSYFIYNSRDSGFPALGITILFSLINLGISSASKSFPLSQREKSY